MTRSAIIALWLVVLASCLQTHSSGTVQIDDQTCVLCHKTDYDNTSSAASALQKIPDHAALGYGTNCTDCHVAQLNPAAWKLATNHPESTFSISSSSKHANIACTACHNVALVDPTNPQVPVGSSVKGANTDCTGCHPNNATQQSSHPTSITFPTGTRYAGTAYAYKTDDHRFCLDCHPSGTGGAHNESIFPSTHNNDGTCTNCHNPALGADTGGMNAPCVNSGCHSRVTSGGHGDGPNVTDPGPTTCLQCHPHGQGGG